MGVSRAGPPIVTGLLHQSGTDWIVLDVPPDLCKFPITTHLMVVAFLLPKGLSCQTQNEVATLGGDTFQ
jgi:hypothetical protein